MRSLVHAVARDRREFTFLEQFRVAGTITVTVSLSHRRPVLMAFELGQRSWKLGFSTGIGQRPRVRQIPAGAVEGIANEILRAKARLGLPREAPVISCYEAGREGFWLHRYLVA